MIKTNLTEYYYKALRLISLVLYSFPKKVHDSDRALTHT